MFLAAALSAISAAIAVYAIKLLGDAERRAGRKAQHGDAYISAGARSLGRGANENGRRRDGPTATRIGWVSLRPNTNVLGHTNRPRRAKVSPR